MRQKVPDNKNARSILEEAEREMKYTLKVSVTSESAFTIVRNVYECFRMLGDTLYLTTLIFILFIVSFGYYEQTTIV